MTHTSVPFTLFNSGVILMLCFGGLCLFVDAFKMIVVVRQYGYTAPDEFFSKCYFFRQVCDIMNGDGVNTKIFNWLFSTNQRLGLLFVSMQLYTVSMFVQLGFATTNTVLSGIGNSLLTETAQVTSFYVSLCSAVLSTLITYVFFLLFAKWRHDIKIFGSAKYSCVLMWLFAANVGLSCAAVILSFQSVAENDTIANAAAAAAAKAAGEAPPTRNVSYGQYIFPVINSGMTLFNFYCLWSKRPSQAGNDMLYFGACDSQVCVGKPEPESKI